MKTKNISSKLNVNKTTVANLMNNEMNHAKGGTAITDDVLCTYTGKKCKETEWLCNIPTFEFTC